MSSFRPIQPAPIVKRDLTPGGDELSISTARLGKRIRSVAQACYVCRQIKAKVSMNWLVVKCLFDL